MGPYQVPPEQYKQNTELETDSNRWTRSSYVHMSNLPSPSPPVIQQENLAELDPTGLP